MIRRPRRAVPAALLALLLLAGCVAVGVWAGQRLAGTREYVSYDRIATELHGITWNEVPVLIAGIAAVVVGLLLLAVAVLPGRALLLPLAEEQGLRGGVTRSGLRTALQETATGMDGVRKARIKVKRKGVKVSAHTDRAQSEGMADAVCDLLTRRVQEIGPQPVRRVRASVHASRKRGVQ
ncbi:hypothetical protein IU433_00210 [Nocardia puris]|uniref:DUF6286 domain-containing protein n=1 Tax=Nocardia puris TaxID=208602 RepID=A0A366DU60_9NOCA|nr:DUF6286 domain-containing protein [Nocardia puris]MBF6210210.1 hypothetical protein [Nocardia puris]MBF6367288.1 hypothetical protein [Nocardia puris]MBF6457471.1 hypothetical protein [Nocardia puris]RBO93626.1 hypothetical protein DFR74_10242 [Nocardia puris]